jgi:hypothetical protein
MMSQRRAAFSRSALASVLETGVTVMQIMTAPTGAKDSGNDVRKDDVRKDDVRKDDVRKDSVPKNGVPHSGDVIPRSDSARQAGSGSHSQRPACSQRPPCSQAGVWQFCPEGFF